jgi:hypothetical protein
MNPDDTPGRAASDLFDDETAGQAGVKILHPKTGPVEAVAVDNSGAGVNPASPQHTESVDNRRPGVNAVSPLPAEKPDPGVKHVSPQAPAWGERQRTSGVKLSSDKPPLEPPKKNQGSPPSGTSPAVIHSQPPPTARLDRCAEHSASPSRRRAPGAATPDELTTLSPHSNRRRARTASPGANTDAPCAGAASCPDSPPGTPNPSRPAPPDAPPEPPHQPPRRSRRRPDHGEPP